MKRTKQRKRGAVVHIVDDIGEEEKTGAMSEVERERCTVLGGFQPT
jgi:hypothetical protein